MGAGMALGGGGFEEPNGDVLELGNAVGSGGSSLAVAIGSAPFQSAPCNAESAGAAESTGAVFFGKKTELRAAK